MSTSLDTSKIKALALDLDGTLLAPGAVLSERTARVINACREKGLQIIFATGRAREAAEKFRIPLGAEGPMVYFNGAIVADMPSGKTLHTCLMDKESVEFCIDLSRQLDIYYQVYFPGTAARPESFLMAEKAGAQRDMYHNHTGILAELGDLKEALGKPGITGVVKTMYLAEPEVLDSVLRPKLEDHFGKGPGSAVYMARTLKTFLEVMNITVSKGSGLSIALNRLGIKSEEVIAFGDEENDLPMFKIAGYSVAPANAKDAVKAAADLVIGTNAEDGVAVFLEEAFLR
ncbi:Cof-type HAD-IIB family hydrolase [Leadbettera azotonutricia]|uniref:Phosphatase YidA n=1 Tax=Leadbettera azotonutricia (strain ATCC BAA-888 / DSM 13862 / ZAS-9) TaxID=545695 RepID=F5YDX4_LEAAZ|nr:Cof-type HAD-IIB family hydrolase [Leadbettera azotonutricia]AEF83441.1 phosphatase YidA [Leadbettera azotonutricia ZAS-9]